MWSRTAAEGGPRNGTRAPEPSPWSCPVLGFAGIHAGERRPLAASLAPPQARGGWGTANPLFTYLQNASSDAVLVSLADKLDNARAMLRDLRSQGSAAWDRFNIQDPQEHLVVLQRSTRVFGRRSDGWMVDELNRTLVTLTGLVTTGHGSAARRLADLDESLDRTHAWIDAEEREIDSNLRS
jgi:hypothetical protein